MKKYQFTPSLTHCEIMRPRTQEEIEHEPILFQSSWDYAMDNGSSIIREFMFKIGKEIEDKDQVLIDSRVHMLMPGWSPAIPGWHLDYVPRSLPNAQPNLSETGNIVHYMCIIGHGISSPEFVIQPLELEIDEIKPIFPQCNEQIEKLNPDAIVVQDNNIWKFTSRDFHRALPANGNGFRFFIRASVNTGRKPVNKIRKQTQVYLPHNFKGW